jgi:hypothetical protein
MADPGIPVTGYSPMPSRSTDCRTTDVRLYQQNGLDYGQGDIHMSPAASAVHTYQDGEEEEEEVVRSYEVGVLSMRL